MGRLGKYKMIHEYENNSLAWNIEEGRGKKNRYMNG